MHKYNLQDASAELAQCIGAWVDEHPTLLAEWDVWDAQPAHLIRFKNVAIFVVFPKTVATIIGYKPWSLDGYDFPSIPGVVLPPNYNLTIDFQASDPQFFDKLYQRMVDVMGDEVSTIWKPL